MRVIHILSFVNVEIFCVDKSKTPAPDGNSQTMISRMSVTNTNLVVREADDYL